MSPAVIIAIITAIGGGGFITALVALRKAGPETTNVLVDAASGVVLLQTGVITDLKADLDALHRQVDILQGVRDSQADRLAALEAALRDRDRDLVTAHAENERLRERVARLEAEVTELRETGNGSA